MSRPLPPEKFDLFALLDTLARPPSPTRNDAGRAEEALAGLTGGQGRVFRVKLGYNPNSSSLGTSVVVLLWGIGLAGVLFQMVGAWLLAAREGAVALPPGGFMPPEGGGGGDTLSPGEASGLPPTGPGSALSAGTSEERTVAGSIDPTGARR